LDRLALLHGFVTILIPKTEVRITLEAFTTAEAPEKTEAAEMMRKPAIPIKKFRTKSLCVLHSLCATVVCKARL
jgi:hypothetical protein